MLKICLLGTFNVQADGQPLTGFVSNKVRALLAYLAVEAGRPHSRESLTGLLWADRTQASAQGNLRYALSNLRKLLSASGADLLTISRQSVQFNLGSNGWVDTAIFQKLFESNQNGPPGPGLLEEAVSLFHGEFLEGLSISDNPAFEEWYTVQREQFHRQMLDALHALAEVRIEQGNYNLATQHAWRQLELEPWNEEAYQQMMRSLALSGQRVAALALYERCRNTLAQELAVEPSEETTKLFKDIQEGKLTRPVQNLDYARLAGQSNVPEPLTSFIGRVREIAEIEKLFTFSSRAESKPPVRLLTLIGAGGCGKTRLAIESARRFSTTGFFCDGIWWVDLARLSHPTQVMQAVAAVLDLRESPDTPLITTLTRYLHNKKLVLLLDNCEHLIDACAEFTETALLSCPELRILATSREALDIDGERTFQVVPLSLPDTASPLSIEKLMDCESVRLFVDRAETALPGFSLTNETAHPIILICRQLDGIPLAIELAARHVKMLPIEQIAMRLEDRFPLLTSGSRTTLPHHRTLRAMLDWTYDFLSEQERSSFQQLSIFSGGWSLEAAEQTIEGDIQRLLTALVNKSLVVIDRTGRYRMLETIRQYGREKLAETELEEPVRRRHFDFFLQFAERSRKGLRGEEQQLWLEQIRTEHENLLSALEWSLRLTGEPVAGLRLAVAMTEFWERTDSYREERQWIERALALADHSAPEQLIGWANIRLSYCAFSLGDFEKLRSCVDRAEEIFCRLEDPEGLGMTLHGRAGIALVQHNDPVAALALMMESLELLESAGDKWDMAESVRCIGYTFLRQGDFGKARTYLNRAYQLGRETRNMTSLVMTLYQLGCADYDEGNYASTQSYLDEGRALARDLGNRGGEMDILSLLGELARSKKDFQQAKVYFEEGLLLANEIGTGQSIAAHLMGLGYISLHYGDIQRAGEQLNESLHYFKEQNMRNWMAGGLAGLAGVAAALGDMEKAARLLGQTDALLKARNSRLGRSNLEEYKHTASKIRTHLTEAQFRAAWKEGYNAIAADDEE